VWPPKSLGLHFSIFFIVANSQRKIEHPEVCSCRQRKKQIPIECNKLISGRKVCSTPCESVFSSVEYPLTLVDSNVNNFSVSCHLLLVDGCK
jgi:hypothetical protein